ncbi:MFS transporter [Candidatus Poribacteria bacterium]|nr:MFS transporter [Candidatus Poribacteria bacterium]
MVASKSDKTSLIILSLAHGVTDLYANFLPALLPVFENKFNLSKTLIGVLIFVVSTSGSLSQVVYGYLGDRWGKRLFLVPGTAVAAIFMSFMPLSPNFWILLVLLIIGGSGVSAFHPHAATSAGDLAKSRRGLSLSIFMTGGTIGFAAGPLVAATLMSSFGHSWIPFFSIFGIVTSLLLYKYAVPEEKGNRKKMSIDVWAVIKPQFKALSILCLIVMFRATVGIVFTNFLSLLIEQRGLSIMIGGSVIFLFLLSIGFGTLLGGYLSDIYSRKRLLIISLLMSTPLLLLLIHSSGVIMAVLLVASGLALGLPNPVPLSMAQELIPEGASTASSLMMGFSWGLAGILALLFGIIADAFGGDVVPAMSIASLLPIAAALFAAAMKSKREI